MSVAHSTHTGTEGCLRRVRECLLWPRIASDVKDYVSKCYVCLAYRTSQTKEPLLQHEVISRPWAKVAADLCESNGRTLLVVSDYFSNFIEVSRLHAVTTQALVRELRPFLHFVAYRRFWLLTMVRSLRLRSSKHSQRAGLSITSPPRQDILNRMAKR